MRILSCALIEAALCRGGGGVPFELRNQRQSRAMAAMWEPTQGYRVGSIHLKLITSHAPKTSQFYI